MAKGGLGTALSKQGIECQVGLGMNPNIIWELLPKGRGRSTGRPLLQDKGVVGKLNNSRFDRL